MAYIVVASILSLVISIVAVSLSAHTKLQRRESKELRELAEKLGVIRDGLTNLNEQFSDPRSDEDFRFEMENIAKNLLACNHETGKDELLVSCAFFTYSRDNDELTEQEIDDLDTLVGMYKSQKSPNLKVGVGEKEEPHSVNRISNPYRIASLLYDDINELEDQHSEKLEKFDSDIVQNIGELLNEFVKKGSEKHIPKNNKYSINLDELGNTEEIAEQVSRIIIFYDGIEEDLDELEELIEEIEEVRKGILQASYS